MPRVGRVLWWSVGYGRECSIYGGHILLPPQTSPLTTSTHWALFHGENHRSNKWKMKLLKWWRKSNLKEIQKKSSLPQHIISRFPILGYFQSQIFSKDIDTWPDEKIRSKYWMKEWFQCQGCSCHALTTWSLVILFHLLVSASGWEEKRLSQLVSGVLSVWQSLQFIYSMF